MPLTGATTYDSATASAAPGASVTDFALLVDLSNLTSEWWNAFDSGGGAGSIRVTDSTGSTEYARDPINVVSNSDGTGTGWLRIGWSGAQSSAPTVRIYPDATGSYATTDTYGQFNTYDSGTAAYFPMEEDPSGSSPQVLDRTSNQNHGTSNGTMVTADLVTGQVGKGLNFDGTDDFISCANAFGISTAMTLEVWARAAAASGRHAYWSSSGMLLEINGTSLRWFPNVDTTVETAAGVITTNWQHIAVSHDASNNFASYVDGVSVDSGASAALNTTKNANYRIGEYGHSSALRWAGDLDDVRVSTVARSAAWIDYEKDQSSDNATFWGTWSNTAVGGGATFTPRMTLLGVG